jgi:hypothetical protein
MRALKLLLFLCSTGFAAETTYWIDEVGQRQLTMVEDEARRVTLSFRWTYDPGALPGWNGNGQRAGDSTVFAVTVADENEIRDPFFRAKRSENRLEIDFRSPDKPDQPDPGIRGVFTRLSDEKRLLVAKREFEAAEARLVLALQNATRDGRHDDKVIVSDWRAKWADLRKKWLSISYAPDGVKPEADPLFWQRLAQATMFGYAFNEQRVDPKNKGGWAGDYNDGFGGSITIRERKEGALRINLNCSRGLDAGDLNVTDVAGDIPASAVKKQGELRTAEAVLELNGGAEGAPPKKVRVKLQRRGGALWVEAVFLQPGDRKGWLDGIYRWYPVPEMAE